MANMANADPLSPDGQALFAIRMLHSFMPLVATAYYFISWIVSAAHADGRGRRKQQSGFRLVTLWLMLAVLVTYGVDSVSLIFKSFSDNQASVRQDNIVFALGSSLVWCTLIVGFADSKIPALFPFSGCWVIYLAAETVGFALWFVVEKRSGKWSIFLAGLRICRLSLLLILCILAGTRVIRAKCTQTDEENMPLLGHNVNNPAHVQHTTTNHGYATMAHGQITSANTCDAISQNAKSEGEESKKRLSRNLETFMFLVPFFWPKGKPHLQLLYVGVGLCLLLDRILNVLVPLQLGLITDILSNGSGKLPWKEIMAFITLRLLDSSGGISAIRRYLWLPLENYSYHKISTAAFDKIMTLSSDFHDNKHSGSLWQSVSRGASVRYIVRSALFQIGPMLVDLVLAVSVLYYLFDAYMALIIAAVVIVFLWSSGKILAKQKEKRRKWISDMEKEHNILCESTANWQTVSYFNRVPHEKSRYSSAVKDHMNSSLIFKLWSHFESVAQSFLLIVGLMGACILAAYQVIRGNKPVGSFVMLLSYWAQLSGPLQFFASGFCDIALDMVNAEELIALLKQKPTVVDQDDAKPLILDRGEVEFKSVEFSYDGRRKILKDLSFRAQPGQTVALVGETGGGKSTILKLISRFYDPARGSILIDGQNIRGVTLESLRANIGVVPQDPALFHDTIINNIRYANHSATDEEIYEACKAVALHDKFLTFADGYQTLVGERGVKLSGGELQRIAIARAIVKNPRIVLLDEATSSVDSETESQIQESLKKLTAGRTTFVIAHRLSTVVNADIIFVIKDGSIVEQGSHEALLKSKGHYYRLWSRQASLEPSSSKTLGLSSGTQYNPTLSDIRNDTEELTNSGLSRSQEVSAANCLIKPQVAHAKSDFPRDECARGNRSVIENTGPKAPNVEKEGSTKRVWKPDAPEFIPRRFQLSNCGKPQTATNNDSASKIKHYEATKENLPGKLTVASEHGDAIKQSSASSTSAKEVISTCHPVSNGNGSEDFGSALDEVNGAHDSQTATAAHAKSKKYKKKRDKRASRRKLSKSGPPDLG